MPTNRPRVTITFTDDDLKWIEDYRWQHRSKNLTQAVISLIRVGMDEVTKGKAPTAESAAEAEETDRIVRQLYKVFLRAGFVRDGDISNDDYIFLDALLTMCKAHFGSGEKDRE